MKKKEDKNKKSFVSNSINDSIFDLNNSSIGVINEEGLNNTYQNNILNSDKISPLYKDDSIFDIKFTKTFNPNNIKSNKRKSAIFPAEARLISLLNFQKNHDFIDNSKKRKDNKKAKINYITYEDTYLENEVFIPSPSSYPGDYSEDSIILKAFSEEYNNNFYYDTDIMNNSFSFKTRKEDHNIYLKLTQMKENENINSYLNIKNNNDPVFVDEKEIRGKNIEYLKGKNDNLEINYYTHTKDKNNISNISLNLFIKKIAKENLRVNYSLLYKSFLEQFSIFLSTDILIEKIINAFYYYKKELSNEFPELINLLNNIVSRKYNLIKNNSEIITKLKNLYSEIKNAPYLIGYLKQDTLSVNYILFGEGEEFDLNFAKYSISQRKKNIIFLKEKPNIPISKSKNKNVKNEIKPKELYFYIFNYTEEEIAISLTSISYRLICNINIEELLNGNFTKKDKNIRSPNVMKFIERFDKINLFIIEDICSYDSPKQRAEAITKWVKIADQCKNLYNFNDTLVINTFFSNYLIKKLFLTWKKLPKSTIKKMNELKRFCSYNQCYLNIRKEIVNRRGRFYIPYLGILLKEIVNFEEKYKYVLENGNINCLKMQKLYMMINQFFSFRNNPFSKAPLKELDILDNLNPKNEEQLEILVKKIEPKLIISAGENKKRITKTDVKYYF